MHISTERLDKKSPSTHSGLSDGEVLQSRATHGSNALTPPEKESLWSKFVSKFKDPIIIILLVAMVLSFAVSCYHYFGAGDSASVFLEPAGVLLAVILATGVAFYFELKSEKEFEILNQVNEDILYKVYRNGKISQVLKNEIVVGDMVILETGEQIPADGQLIEAISLQVDESSLTGEPVVNKTIHAEDFDEHATYPSDYLCRGTTILDGHCTYRVDKVGDATEYGRVFEGTQIDASVQTPLNRQLDQLARLITKISYSIAALVLIGSVLVYVAENDFDAFDWADAMTFFLNKIMIAVTIIVVAVPEGLPMSVTLSLAYSMRSMMKTNNLVRKMHACETMGAATVICTDKTGTLTQNRMTVAETFFAPAYQDQMPLIAEAMAANSTAHLDYSDEKTVRSLGNPTEGALLLWLSDKGIDYLTVRESCPIVLQLTFSTERKYMATVVHSATLGKPILLVKGAPEIVMSFCSSLAQEQEEAYRQKLVEYQNKAMRTIGFAYKELSSEEEEVFANGRLHVHDLNFMGVVGISDPIRHDVPEAIDNCMQAGIQVKIVTGDTPGTAREIGRQIGLWDESCTDRCLITGADFAALSDDEIRTRLGDLRIMSRARPMDKERLVRLLQEEGEVVAVTGDGTNDAPALNRAQVGLSMGDGTAVAKEASDITILDNSFNSIAQAVMWGRSLYLNIRRFILFQMTINVVACIIVLIGAFLGTESPLTVTQMLWVNLIMDTFAALALASLPPDKAVMKDKPRHQEDPIISPQMAKRIFALGIAFVLLLFSLIQYFKHAEVNSMIDFSLSAWAAALTDFSPVENALSGFELSAFFSIFVFLQFWNMFNAKAFMTGRSALRRLSESKNFMLIALLILGGQILITTLGGEMFRVVPLKLIDWIIIVLSTSVIFWIGEITRIFSRKDKMAGN